MQAIKLSLRRLPVRSVMPVGCRRACWVLMFCPFLPAAQTQNPPTDDQTKPEPVRTSIISTTRPSRPRRISARRACGAWACAVTAACIDQGMAPGVRHIVLQR